MGVHRVRAVVSKAIIASAFLVAGAHTAAAQYSAQILLPPSGFPQGAFTRGYAMNESGQVFGEVVLSSTDRRPVLWTDGVGEALPIPDGYYWSGAFDPLGYQFVNDSGLVVSRLRIANGVPNSNWDESRVVVWQNGVPQVLQPPDSCGQSDTGHQFVAPWGLNNPGHILFATFGDNLCGRLWLWNGSGSQVVFDINTPPTFGFTPARTHLNDADHVAIDRLPGSPTCDSNGTIAGILTGAQFTPITGAGALQINNHDHVLLYCTVGGQSFLKLWDGAALVDLGFGGAASMNDLGQVVFLTGVNNEQGPKIYKDGVVSDLQLPMFPQTVGIASGSLVNSSGQIVISEVLMLPNGGVTDQAVLFTPRTPVITWSTPADITYGTALGPAQLNATANVPGTFAYTPAAGTVLNAGPGQTLSLTFTPSNLTLYDPTAVSTNINVLPAPLTVAADDATKFFGAPLPSFSASFTGFVNGDGPGSLAGPLSLTTAATATSPVGTYPIVASGVSSPNYTIGFLPGTLTIAPANTTTTAFAFPTAAGLLQPVILVAQVGPVAPGAGVPDGPLQFKDGSALLGTATLSNGLAFLLANGLTSGAHTITAEYAGSSSFASSTSPSVGVTIQPAAASTFTLLFPLTAPQASGQPAVFAALVIRLGPGATPTGTVQFTDGTTVLGAAPLSGGVAIFSTSALGAGLHTIGARYNGGAGLAASSASPVLQTIYTGAPPAATTTTLAVSPSPSTVDQPVTFTATVTGGATTGEVYFYVDGFALGRAPLTNVGGSFQASLTLSSFLSAGIHVVSAVYGGSAGFAASTLLVPAFQVIQPPVGAGSATASVSDLEAAIGTVLRK
jgi:hypothetical protein